MADNRTTTQRGLGHTHRRNRAGLLAQLHDGTPCWWCGRGMYREPANNPDGRALHADHTRARSKGNTAGAADRLLHDLCNKQRGDGSRDHRRPALLAARQRDAERRRRDEGALVNWPELPALIASA
ncbi:MULTISPECIES: hypothetical protein [unclassified Dietzia]|uniref:hypothetical protein n=1 Tax=unclassified Dietzia TaxID=2617939 RepID=UPI0015F7B87C|nr:MULTISPECIES: hypothetical protein [unclassified Dietzia]